MPARLGRRQIDRRAAGLAAAAIAAILALVVLELLAPPFLPLGAAVLVLVVISSLYLDGRLVVAIVAVAVAGRALDAALGGISSALAALETACFIAAAGAGLASRRRSGGSQRDEASAAATTAPSTVARFSGAPLTEREREVIEMAVRGLTAGQIAERLHISKRTVETHLERVSTKLGVRSKRELIATAFDEARSGG